MYLLKVDIICTMFVTLIQEGTMKNKTLVVDSAYHRHTVHNIDLESFSSLDIVKILDIQRERLRDWQSRGFIRASREAEKQGKRAYFSRLDVYAIGLFKNLVEIYRFSRDEAS